jgi:hypothetical protein
VDTKLSSKAVSDVTPASSAGAWGWNQGLDAIAGMALLEPLVGVVWQRALGHCLGLRVDIHYSLLLGASLWLVYIADRWLDARVLQRGVPCAARHRFAAEHRRVLAVVWVCVLLLDVGLALYTLSAVEWTTRLGLLLATAGYFWAVHSRFAAAPKELLVAAIYTAGVTVFAWPVLGWFWTWPLTTALAVAGFGLLALLNLATIAASEHALDRAQGFPSLGHGAPWLERAVDVFAVALAGACFAGAVFSSAVLDLGHAAWFLALGACALALLLLGRLGRRMHPDHFHLAADAALLLPVLSPWL